MEKTTDIILVIGEDLKKCHLVTENENAQKFWHFAMDTMAEVPGAYLKLNLDETNHMHVKMASMPGEGQLGGFLHKQHFGISINLLKRDVEAVKDQNGVLVRFLNDKAIATFLHEFGHFVHFEVDKGVCRSLPYFGQSWPKEAAEDEWDDAMFIHEYEAGYRAIFWASFYKIIDPKLAKIDNIGNLWKFWNHNDPSGENDKKVCDFLKKKGVDGKIELEVKLMDETIFPQFTKKYSEYGDPRLDLSFINYDI